MQFPYRCLTLTQVRSPDIFRITTPQHHAPLHLWELVVEYDQPSTGERRDLVSGSTRVLSVLDDRAALASGTSNKDQASLHGTSTIIQRLKLITSPLNEATGRVSGLSHRMSGRIRLVCALRRRSWCSRPERSPYARRCTGVGYAERHQQLSRGHISTPGQCRCPSYK